MRDQSASRTCFDTEGKPYLHKTRTYVRAIVPDTITTRSLIIAIYLLALFTRCSRTIKEGFTHVFWYPTFFEQEISKKPHLEP